MRAQDPARAFRVHLAQLIIFSLLSISVCASFTVVVARHANIDLNALLRGVQPESPTHARRFLSSLSALETALLNPGHDAQALNAQIEHHRASMRDWISAREALDGVDADDQRLPQLRDELKAFFGTLDALRDRSQNWTVSPDPALLADFSRSALRLDALVSTMEITDDQTMRELVRESVTNVDELRLLVFCSISLLFILSAGFARLFYLHLVRPLRQQLGESRDQLAKKEKLAALGTLAAGVAHEIRNPLTAIKARLYTLARTQTDPNGEEDVQSIKAEVLRLEKIVSNVLGYARTSDPQLEPLALGPWLREFRAFLATQPNPPHLTLDLTISADATVQADPDQLRQVLLNLVLNAREALGDRPGTISLTLDTDHAQIRGHKGLAAVLGVRDTGPGIPPDLHARLFDPFFTSKPGGTGLGLSIVSRLIEKMNGDITFQTAEGVGTVFRVRLPLSDSGT